MSLLPIDYIAARPCEWEQYGYYDLVGWGKTLSASKDASVEKYNRWDAHMYAEIPTPPDGYFIGENADYYLQRAIMAAWKYWGTRA